MIKHSKVKWQSKKLDGGEPDDKDITLYCGPKSEAIKAANGIKNHQYLYSLIKPPKSPAVGKHISSTRFQNILKRIRKFLYAC
jgi:hypothetical protein